MFRDTKVLALAFEDASANTYTLTFMLVNGGGHYDNGDCGDTSPTQFPTSSKNGGPGALFTV